MFSLEDFVREMPKVELHVHLEGSVRPQTLLTLAMQHGIALPATSAEGLQEWYRFTSFPHFVQIYKTISACIRTTDDIELITREFLAEQARQRVLYSEVTYTTFTHFQQKGIPFSEQMAAINRARVWGRDTLGVEIGLILDIDRSLTPEEGEITARWAVESMADGVVALGLGGPEVGNPPEKFERAFAIAREAGLRSIPHAGETVGPESIANALHILGARRIGHGVRCLEDPALVDELRARQIPLEVCPTSNVCLGVAPSWQEHPLPRLIEAGLYVTLNSDDPPMFNTTLTQEYLNAVRVFGFDRQQIEGLVRNAVQAACLPDDRKAALAAHIEARMAELRARLAPAAPASAYAVLLRRDAFEFIRLTPQLIFVRWFRTPTVAEGMQFVKDVEDLLNAVPGPTSFISDLRRGAIKDVRVIDKLTSLPAHPHWAHATAFGSVSSAVYSRVYERLAHQKGYEEETWPSFEKAIQYLEQQQPGLTQGIDWPSVLQAPDDKR
ncbi:MAG: adenosine deaminase [Anaerolineae bacterium]|nr:adenosine deaminase [Anaerolineae bacterium]